jgi:hypothetical protein
VTKSKTSHTGKSHLETSQLKQRITGKRGEADVGTLLSLLLSTTQPLGKV